MVSIDLDKLKKALSKPSKEEQEALDKAKSAMRDPYQMCKQYGDPVVFRECIQFYVDQNEQLAKGKIPTSAKKPQQSTPKKESPAPQAPTP